jgi:hypothetical protein
LEFEGNFAPGEWSEFPFWASAAIHPSVAVSNIREKQSLPTISPIE